MNLAKQLELGEMVLAEAGAFGARPADFVIVPLLLESFLQSNLVVHWVFLACCVCFGLVAFSCYCLMPFCLTRVSSKLILKLFPLNKCKISSDVHN